ncbi:MAG: hypothetical protein AAF330_04350 [Pseudomonadota bacterium]
MSRQVLSAVKARLLSAEGDVSSLIADLVVFLGYFGLCFYAGGVAFANAYNGALGLKVLPVGNIVATAQLFFFSAFGQGGGGIVLAFGVAALCLLYLVARFALRLWSGFFSIVMLFSLSVAGCMWIGASHGAASVGAAFLRDANPLPVFKAAPTPDKNYEDGSYRLLHENATHLFVVQPTDDPASVREVLAVLKSELPTYEVRLP